MLAVKSESYAENEIQRVTSVEDPSPEKQLSPQMQEVLKRDGLFGLGEAYIAGLWQTDNLDDFLYRIVRSINQKGRGLRARMIWHFLKERFINSQIGSKAFEVAHKHYDLGNQLFSTMLDSTMSYTCGYWATARTLEEAQTAKLKLICEKLKLKPGMRALDIGCGWGNFAAYAAKNYGVSVTGLTVSKEQAGLARERCKGLSVEILLQDYQTFSGSFDRIVSIEMIEAVGRKNLSTYFAMASRCLKEGGLFVLQVISAETFSRASTPALDQFIVWLVKHIFPNGYLPKIYEITAPARHSLVIEDIHNLGGDYDRTLKAWDQNFAKNWGGIKKHYDEEFYRKWRYYLNGCMAVFRARLVQVYQIVYSKGVSDYSSSR